MTQPKSSRLTRLRPQDRRRLVTAVAIVATDVWGARRLLDMALLNKSKDEREAAA